MSIETIKEALPEYAKDLKLNLSSALRQKELTETQIWGTLTAVAAASRSKQLVEWIYPEAKEHLDEATFTAARGAAALMGMNNVFYRTLHLAEDESLLTKPAGLRMNFMKSHGASAQDFELWSLAVSAVNGCGMCITSHRKHLLEAGVSDDQILAALRIASVLSAINAVLIESAFENV